MQTSFTGGNVCFKIKPPTLSCEQSKTVFCSESGDLRNLCIATSSVVFGIVCIKRLWIQTLYYFLTGVFE